MSGLHLAGVGFLIHHFYDVESIGSIFEHFRHFTHRGCISGIFKRIRITVHIDISHATLIPERRAVRRVFDGHFSKISAIEHQSTYAVETVAVSFALLDCGSKRQHYVAHQARSGHAGVRFVDKARLHERITEVWTSQFCAIPFELFAECRGCVDSCGFCIGHLKLVDDEHVYILIHSLRLQLLEIILFI